MSHMTMGLCPVVFAAFEGCSGQRPNAACLFPGFDEQVS